MPNSTIKSTGPRPELAWVSDLSNLVYDPQVQRREGVRTSRVEAMAADFTPYALGSLTLSKRPNGDLAVLDGAHRVNLCRLVGWREPVPALVYSNLTTAQEAAMFKLLNTFQQPSFISRMLASVVAGETDATRIVQTIERHGWTIGISSEDGIFAALQAAERIYKTGVGSLPADRYPELLDTTMAVLTAAWHHDRESSHNAVVQGVGLLFARMGEGIDKAALVKRMSQERPYAILAHAKTLKSSQGGTVPSAYAKVLVGLYNKQRRTNLLPDWTWTR